MLYCRCLACGIGGSTSMSERIHVLSGISRMLSNRSGSSDVEDGEGALSRPGSRSCQRGIELEAKVHRGTGQVGSRFDRRINLGIINSIIINFNVDVFGNMQISELSTGRMKSGPWTTLQICTPPDFDQFKSKMSEYAYIYIYCQSNDISIRRN